MKLLIILGQKEDAEKLFQKLTEEKFSATKFEGRSGPLLRETILLLVPVEEKKLRKVFSLTKEVCSKRIEYLPSEIETLSEGQFLEMPPMPIKMGGATVFVLKIEDFKEF